MGLKIAIFQRYLEYCKGHLAFPKYSYFLPFRPQREISSKFELDKILSKL
jgi:hypothetical protein